jgi:hypothetical protein
VKQLEFLADQKGKLKGVFVPIELWKKVFPQLPASEAEFKEALENYVLNKAMDEARKTPLLSKEEAMKFLEDK